MCDSYPSEHPITDQFKLNEKGNCIGYCFMCSRSIRQSGQLCPQALYNRADALITVAISKGEKLLNQKAGDKICNQ